MVDLFAFSGVLYRGNHIECVLFDWITKGPEETVGRNGYGYYLVSGDVSQVYTNAKM